MILTLASLHLHFDGEKNCPKVIKDSVIFYVQRYNMCSILFRALLMILQESDEAKKQKKEKAIKLPVS